MVREVFPARRRPTAGLSLVATCVLVGGLVVGSVPGTASAVAVGAVGASPLAAGTDTSWSIVPSPNVSSSPLISLRGVSCSGVWSCAAVGYYATSGPTLHTLIESWNGSVWSTIPSPNTPMENNELLGVSCTGPSACFAVGDSDPGMLPDLTLIESWNGSVWSIVPSPDVPSAQSNFLNGVSCSGPSACTAVGTTQGQTLIESWNGKVWSIVPSPNVPSAYDNVLSGVSCSGPTACTAVGTYAIGAYIARGLIESWNGSVWSIVLSPNLPSDQDNMLNGVSCSGPSSCTAVGASFSPSRTLIESWDGSGWSIVPSPNRSRTPHDDFLGDVSCNGPTVCTAVGASDGSHQTLVESTPAPGNIFATTFKRCTILHVGYNRFVNGTVVHWRVTSNGFGTVASGQFNAIGGGKAGSKTYHFLSIPLGTTLRPEPVQSHVLYTWANGGRFSATRDPGC